MSFIYVLHFDQPLAHAEHYVGCTDNIRARVTAHALGAGSRLTRELYARGIGWRLGGLYQCTHRRMRSLERSLKDQKHASRYCEICNRVALTFRGTVPYDISCLPWATDSLSLAAASTPKTGQTVRLTTPQEPRDTVMAILHLMRRDKDALGFVPAGGSQGIEQLIPRGLIAVAESDGEVIGYASHTCNPSQTRVTIHQCVVRDDARLLGLGRHMVDLVAGNHANKEVVAKVRTDLAANHFWQAIGFTEYESIRHKTSKALIHHYVRPNLLGETPCLSMRTNKLEHTKSTTTEKGISSPTSRPES